MIDWGLHWLYYYTRIIRITGLDIFFFLSLYTIFTYAKKTPRSTGLGRNLTIIMLRLWRSWLVYLVIEASKGYRYTHTHIYTYTHPIIFIHTYNTCGFGSLRKSAQQTNYYIELHIYVILLTKIVYILLVSFVEFMSFRSFRVRVLYFFERCVLAPLHQDIIIILYGS